MKGTNFSCSSPAAAAVCTSIDRRSVVRPTIVGRSIDRHLRTKRLGHLPKPKARPTSLHQRPSTARASTSTCNLTSPANSSRYLLDGESTIFDVHTDIEPEIDLFDKLRIRTAGRSSIHTSTPCRLLKPMKENETSSTLVRSAPSTARAHHGHVWAQSKSDRSHHDQGAIANIDSPKLLPSSGGDKQPPAVLRPSNSNRSCHDQVVVLRVSLHCKGCEGKVRKHISKMEGVTSFNIDFASKKVTVKGDITPLGVLNSVSKVKNAQFWPSPPRASASF